MAYDLPPPRDWQDFEDLCLDLFRALWNAPGAMQHGRSGQPQAGVDVFGLPSGSAEWFGVQCKKKLGREVTERELRDEVEKATGFNPKLARFVLATTTRCDVSIQQVARTLTEEVGFEVLVYDWDHLSRDIQRFPDVLETHYPNLVAADPADLRSHYLRQLFEELDVVQVSKLSRSRKDDIALSKVYIDLDVSVGGSWSEPDEGVQSTEPRRGLPNVGLKGELPELQRVARRITHEAKQKKSSSGKYARLCTALEAAATASRRVLLGRGGSGKSTFSRYLCLCLAGELIQRPTLNHSHLNGSWAEGDPELHPWPHGPKVPFFVELRRFVRSDRFPKADQDGKAQHLSDYLTTLGPEDADMGRVVRGALEKGALVVLDGLDETPQAGQVRERLRQVIGGFVKTYPDCRVVVTSRPHAYEHGQDWRLDDAGFVEETLAPLDDPKIQRFVTIAYKEFAMREQLAPEDQEQLAEDLLREIRSQESLQKLAEQPLMLTMMTDLHTREGGTLPSTRSLLFEESVGLLFDRWNESRMLPSVRKLMGMSKEQIRSALELLAFRVHGDGGNARDGAADVPEEMLLQALVETRKRLGNKEAMVPEEICDHLNQRSGILIAESPTLYRFPHRYFQEYLAACHLKNFPAKRASVLAERPGLWRESILFLAGRLTNGDGIWSLLRELVPGPPTEEVEQKDLGFLRALLAGLAIREHRLWEREEADHQPKIEDVRLWMRRAVELGALEVKDRAQAGQVLGLLGDDRPGVGLGNDGLPQFEWVEIPSGSFTMGGEEYDDEKPIHEATVDAFCISRLPVTNAQYQAFVDDGGYTERRRSYWTESGWEWWQGQGREGPREEPSPFDLPNHPRINVSWYESVAFCNWLAERTGVAIRLPTETEWERAARGTDGREYPWGDGFDASKCNSGESEIGSTTAVGLFSEGESSPGVDGEGMLDASGNVWEWCSTQWRNNYEEEAVEDLAGSASRVLRGGSFAVNFIDARCAYRVGFDPGSVYWVIGFRVASPSVNSDV